MQKRKIGTTNLEYNHQIKRQVTPNSYERPQKKQPQKQLRELLLVLQKATSVPEL